MNKKKRYYKLLLKGKIKPKTQQIFIKDNSSCRQMLEDYRKNSQEVVLQYSDDSMELYTVYNNNYKDQIHIKVTK